MALPKSLERLVDEDVKLTKQDKERRKGTLLRAKIAGKEYLDLIAEALEKETRFTNIIVDLKAGIPNAKDMLVWREGYKAAFDHLKLYLTERE